MDAVELLKKCYYKLPGLRFTFVNIQGVISATGTNYDTR